MVASAEAWRAASWEENKEDLRVLYEVRCGAALWFVCVCPWKGSCTILNLPYPTLDIHTHTPLQDFLKVSEANEADALKDEDGNGIADVDELDATRFFLRKVNLMLVSVNPETLSEATK